MNEAKIKKFWDQQAEEFGTSYEATVPDKYAKQLELEAICRYLKDGQRVADIGCGNGYSCAHYCRQFDVNVTGLDYSESMIEQAKLSQSSEEEGIASRLHFSVASILDTGLRDDQFDVAITDRCIINLTERSDQANAVKEIARILKPGGLYLMCENTEQSLANLNEVRELADLDKIQVRWHNLYLDETHIKSAWTDDFELVEEHRFGGFYYLASRVINALVANEAGETPDYLSPINKAAAEISAKFDCGDFGPVKLFVLRKR